MEAFAASSPPPLWPPPPPDPSSPPAGSEKSPDPPEFALTPRPWSGLDSLGLDRLGLTQAIGGLVLGLIALFSSYDHITFASRSFPLQQQWGIPLIAASVASVFVDTQLATGSRLRAALEREVDRDRADQDRDRAVEARERQAESLERLDQAALLSARVQLDPNPTNRARLQFFLTLMANRDGTES